jgi:hypothetical protein
MSYPMNTLERAMLNVEPDANTGCWLWSGGMFSSGYGRLSYKGKSRLAHRFVYEQMRGTIPHGFFALHKCDTPACVNPAHIFIGTAAHNQADCVTKQRKNGPTGEAHGMAKLSAAQAMEVRRLALSREMPQHAIADMFGISQSNVSMIKRGHGWRNAFAAREGVTLEREEAA